MGVHNLWELLSPVGRRVSVETLAGKKLAIDASIWMVQFMKAMRDEKGDMVQNAHLLGFFRRICKLLYLRTKPVFVFDGGTPFLKRRTVIARRRQRENAQAKIRKTAEKLLLNHLKKMRLKELTDDLELQRKMQKKDKVSTGEACQSNMMANSQKLGERSEEAVPVSDFSSNTSKAAMTIPLGGEHVDEDWDLEEIDGNVDPDVLAALPPSMQRKFILQNDRKGKSMIHDSTGHFHEEENIRQKNVEASSCYGQEKLDEMFAASLMAEEGQGKTYGPSTSSAAFPSVEEDDDEEEEMLLPVMNGNVDPAVLAALPPSMQLDLLVQMRERLIGENRQKYQKVKKAPEKFSELQIQSYLKTVAFRREIDEVQKAASGRGIGGVQTSRIASEANREFIFSSSFTGDKHALTSARVEKNGDKQTQIHSKHPSEFLSSINANKSDDMAEVDTDDPGSPAQEAVETYVDERGRTRVSRVRAMGIRMTRDLQRNLDLMNEIEQEKADSRNDVDDEPAQDKEGDSSQKRPSSENKFAESKQDGCSGSMNLEVAERPSVLNETSVEVTFECDGEDIGFDEDDIFARLAAGDPLQEPSARKSPPTEKSFYSDSDVDWEEVSIQEKINKMDDDVNVTKETFSHESDVDWEEPSKFPESSYSADESRKSFSKGSLEEEADLEEAIRRSLIDLNGNESSNISVQIENSRNSGEVSSESMGVFMKEHNKEVALGENITVTNKLFCEVSHGVGKLSDVGYAKASDTVGCPSAQFKISATQVSDNQMPKPSDKHTDSSSEHSREDTRESINIDKTMSFVESITGLEGKEDLFDWNARNEGGQPLTSSSECHRDSSHNLTGILADSIFLDKNNSEAGSSILLGDRKEQNETSVFLMESDRNKLASDLCAIDEQIAETSDALLNEGKMKMDKVPINENNNAPIEFPEANLDEELLILGEECRNLKDEQRKLERNAESASSEMFAECQELLQMFGLPYIIAPMEAEAQCAYLELANLVDGVVTDDSDVFLFGARNVYKNIFDDRKYVETYFMEDIEKELGLTREKLIRMALLLGSDYTEGVSGIGIVNAIEVLNAFPEDDGLSRFREWIESPDPSILGVFDVNGSSHLRRRESKNSVNDMSSGNGSAEFCPSNGRPLSDQNISQADIDQKSAKMKDMKQNFMDKHRNVSKNWHLPSSFPSKDVILAYSSPQVDKSTEPFSWGKPDLFILHRLCWEKFGWGSQKTDELLKPVLKEYEKRETQLRLEAFYTFNERFAEIRSKRIKKAVKGITGNIPSEVVDDCTKDVKRASKKRKDNTVGSGGQTVPEILKKKNPAELIPCEAENKERSVGANNRHITNKKSNLNQRGKGRGAGRGKGKATYDFEQSETSTSDDGTIDEHHVSTKKFEQLQEVRRSVRARKPVNYALSDEEIDETSIPKKDENFPTAEAKERDFSDTQDGYGDIGAGDASRDDRNQGEESNPPVEGSCGVYLVNGGGFCSDEGKDGNRSGDPSSDGGLSKGYLESGGGFCLDDDNANEGTNAALNPDTFGATESSHTPCFMQEDINSDKPVAILGGSCSSSGMVDEEKRGTADVPSPNVASVVNEGNIGESLQDKANIRLSAMPYLKRKRRKS